MHTKYMFNLGDDSELDRFSKEAAGKYSPPGEPNWDKLSAELDKVMPVEEKKKACCFSSGGCCLYYFWVVR